MQRSGERNLNDATSQLFYHASVLILISAVAQGPWVNEDCSLAAENLRRAVYGAGLGNCWIGFAQSSPGGYLIIPHPWPGQNPPPGDGGTRDDYAV
jgi:nitroreductase